MEIEVRKEERKGSVSASRGEIYNCPFVSVFAALLTDIEKLRDEAEDVVCKISYCWGGIQQI
jgi:hypothetical protein